MHNIFNYAQKEKEKSKEKEKAKRIKKLLNDCKLFF